MTLWITEEALAGWQVCEKNGRRGRDYTYSMLAIECALTVKNLFNLTLRKTQGFLEGLISILDVGINAPNYSTLSRRAEDLEVALGNIPSRDPIHILIDASGLKVFGEGEWKMRTHGKDKRRTWRKVHIAIDRVTQEIVSLDLTKSNVHDSKRTSSLVKQAGKLASVTGDKGYDNKNAYDPIARAGARAIIPPRSGAAKKMKNITVGDVERNRNITENQFLGKGEWKHASGYSKRSLVETSIYRYKSQFSGVLRSRNLKTQVTDARIRAAILNKMTHLGMPKSYKI